LHHCLFFLSRSLGMASDIGSLAAGLDGHDLRLRIGLKGLRKNGKLAIFFFGALTFSTVNSVAIASQNISTYLPTVYCQLLPTLTFLESLDSSLFRHFVAHYTRLVNPGQVLHVA
jgi:hypothetical protein